MIFAITCKVLELVNFLEGLREMMLLVYIDRTYQILDLISTFNYLLEVTVVGHIINWSLEVFDDLCIANDLIKVVLVISVVNRSYQILQFLSMFNNILEVI